MQTCHNCGGLVQPEYYGGGEFCSSGTASVFYRVLEDALKFYSGLTYRVIIGSSHHTRVLQLSCWCCFKHTHVLGLISGLHKFFVFVIMNNRSVPVEDHVCYIIIFHVIVLYYIHLSPSFPSPLFHHPYKVNLTVAQCVWKFVLDKEIWQTWFSHAPFCVTIFESL